MPIAPIKPIGVKTISVSIPNNVLKQLNAGTYVGSTQVVATAKDGKKFITTLTNVIDWIINTGSRVADVLNNLGVINTRQIQNQIPQYDTEPVDDGTGESDIVFTNDKGKVLKQEKELTPPTPEKPKTFKVLGAEITPIEGILGIGLGYLILKKK